MNKLAMSPPAAGLIRQMLARSGLNRDQVLLSHYRSVDWCSLTFTGERHELGLRVIGPDAATLVERLVDGLADFEFDIAGQIVADIAVQEEPVDNDDGSISLAIEALTVAA